MKNPELAPMGRYIDLLTDFGFKKVFDSEPNKDVLIAFLNELFKGRRVIRDLVYNPQENSGPATHCRKSIFDVTCTEADGTTFIVEVQRASQQFFADRAIFYTASSIYEQGPKGNKHWDFELKEVYFIGVANFNFNNYPPGQYLRRVRLVEEETGFVYYNKLEFIFLELPNFTLKESDINTGLERWLYVLRNMGQLAEIPVTLCDVVFQKLFKIAKVANLKAEEYMLYQKDLLDRWTEYAVLKTAEEKGMAEGEAKGKTKGKAEVVSNLISKFGFTDEQAMNAAGGSHDFVKKIRASVEKKK